MEIISPRVSILIPSYNQAAYLEQALCSILDQEYSQLELIVIDGGSTDGSMEIIQKYASRLAYWESAPDRGQGHAINKGLGRATGDLITFLGSDDLLLPGVLADLARRWPEILRGGYGAVIGAFQFIDESGQAIGEPIRPILGAPAPLDLTLGTPYRLHQVSTFYTRTALDAVGRQVREDLHYVMDRELLYRVALRLPLLLVEQSYGAFRRHPESKSRAAILPFAQEFARLHLEALDGNQKTDRLRRKAARKYLAKGHVNLAKTSSDRWQAGKHLIRAGAISPVILGSYGYWKAWIEKLKLGDRKGKMEQNL